MKQAYSLLAPYYDAVVQLPFAGARALSLKQLAAEDAGRVLIDGIGTGLDMPFLPRRHRYTGIDLTPAMLAQAARRASRGLDLRLARADCRRLPFADASFDHAVLHLILAVVDDPAAALAEAARVVRPGGCVLVLDKFLRRGQFVPLLSLLNPLAQTLVTRLDLVFEDVLDAVPGFRVETDVPVLFAGWVRAIRLRRDA